MTVLCATLEEFECLLRLALTKGDVIDFNALVSGEFIDEVRRVNTLCQDNDDGHIWPRVLEDILNLSGLGCDELLVI